MSKGEFKLEYINYNGERVLAAVQIMELLKVTKREIDIAMNKIKKNVNLPLYYVLKQKNLEDFKAAQTGAFKEAIKFAPTLALFGLKSFKELCKIIIKDQEHALKRIKSIEKEYFLSEKTQLELEFESNLALTVVIEKKIKPKSMDQELSDRISALEEEVRKIKKVHMALAQQTKESLRRTAPSKFRNQLA